MFARPIREWQILNTFFVTTKICSTNTIITNKEKPKKVTTQKME